MIDIGNTDQTRIWARVRRFQKNHVAEEDRLDDGLVDCFGGSTDYLCEFTVEQPAIARRKVAFIGVRRDLRLPKLECKTTKSF
ncbi:hypothetical protein L484_011195 [Morus notabilis]|uniref:Uncharacterized protein n=1 Tax=Morus notabilis TaxID=981085 RepID=W9SYR4_9ROSA|nr:hypothetical protein L484_011195 [Morus notabilis]